jgi:hypothetical protein
MANGASGENKSTLLSVLKELTFFVAIYLYFMGFVYIYYFYDSFGIPLRSIDTPIYYFFVYSYNVLAGLQDVTWGNVLKHKPLWTIAIAVLVGGVVLVFLYRGSLRRVILFSILIILFPFLFYLARETAKEDALGIRTGVLAKEITLVFKKDASAKTSVRLVRGFLTGKDEDEKKTSDSLVLSNPKDDAGRLGLKCLNGEINQETVNAKVPHATDNAEITALARFVSANMRSDLCQETDAQTNRVSNWPKLYLVTETSDFFYVILQPSVVKTEDEDEYGFGYVYEVAKSNVLLSEVRIPQPE